MARENGVLTVLSLHSAKEFLEQRSRFSEKGLPEKTLKIEMQFEREFVRAGGLLMAGCDPTGYGGVVPGFGDQRNIELLVEGGFTPVEAIQIATLNGAKFLGKDATLGSIAPGKVADLIVLGGNPVEKIENIEKVETVFKDGIGFDSAALIQSVVNLVGLR
jgi:imidazolonepropionase-like amidohydrolase